MSPELRAALDNAYQVFARYKDPQRIAALCGIPRALQQLTRDDWGHMNSGFDMMLLIYSDKEQMFRHYLPLLLEWECEGKGVTDLDFPLANAHWLKWPSEEVEALRVVFEAWVREILSRQSGKMPLYFLLEVEDDLTRYLNHWVRARPLEVAQWLWMQDWTQPKAMVLRWAMQPLIEEKLEAAFWAGPDSQHAGLLSRSIELVRSLRSIDM